MLGRFLESFQKEFNYSVEILDPEFRFSEKTKFSDNQKVLAYGSSETQRLFAQQVKAPQVFFGGDLSLTVIEGSSKDGLKLALKDGFSLGQKGCFSARALFYIGDQELNKKELVETLEEISLEDLKIEITERGSIALDHELVNLSPKQTRKLILPFSLSMRRLLKI